MHVEYIQAYIIIYLHGTWDTLAIAEDLVQVFGAQNVPQRSLRQ